MSAPTTWLDDEAGIEWNDFENASAATRRLARRLAGDKTTLRELVEAVGSDSRLMSKCERHQLMDYLVIYDALDRGFRIRLNFSTSCHLHRPHDHRFSFTTLILCGSYQHIWHEASAELEGEALSLGDLRSRFHTMERAGSCYSIHHSVVHTTVTTADTVSLMIRGPAAKERSIIIDKETGVSWRYGAHQEGASRRVAVQMSTEFYLSLCAKAARLSII